MGNMNRLSWRTHLWIGSAVGLLIAVLPIVGPAQTGDTASLEQRVMRIERLVNSRSLVELMDAVDRLQQELKALRGEMETQGHALRQLKAHQRELYLDVDRRLQRLETDGGGRPSPPPLTSDGPPQTPSSSAAVPETGAAAAEDEQAAAETMEEHAAYQRAFELLKEGNYDQATAALETFLAQHPGGAYADNAQYWLGEAYYAVGDFEAALREFSKLSQQYPTSTKVSHAELKMGYIYHELGQRDQAQQVLTQLVGQYPNTTVAQLAQERLEQIEREGR